MLLHEECIAEENGCLEIYRVLCQATLITGQINGLSLGDSKTCNVASSTADHNPA